MADGSTPESAAPPEAAPQAGLPWWALGLGFAGVFALALAAGALTLVFLQGRTANLKTHTNLLSAAVDTTLREQLPPQNIVRSAPTLETAADDSAVWFSYDYEVEVPPNINMEGIKTLLHDTMLDHKVRLVEAPGTATQRTLRLALADYEFATVTLRQPQPKALEPQDLRAQAYRIARDAEQVLIDSGVPAGKLRRFEAEDQQDGQLLWATTRIEAFIPPTLDPIALAAAIESRLSAQDVAVDVLNNEGGATLKVVHAGKVFAEIRCSESGEAVADDMPSITEILPDLGPAIPESAAADEAPLESIVEGEMEAKPAESEPAEEESGEDNAEDIVERPADEGPVKAAPLRGLSMEPPKAREQPRDQTPRVAIIMDDGGWGGETTSRVLDLDPRLTLAILPYADFDEDTALTAAERGFEIMLHMPMETYGEGEKPYQSELNTRMDKDEVQRLARAAIAEVPGIVGVNNHRGSAFTDDAERMGWFLEVVEEESLYFVDSVTLSSSQAYEVAREMAIPTAERDVFLDHENTEAFIRKQFDELMETAKTEGSAIGIGHFRETTVDMLEELLPRLEEEGIALVPASELVR